MKSLGVSTFFCLLFLLAACRHRSDVDVTPVQRDTAVTTPVDTNNLHFRIGKLRKKPRVWHFTHRYGSNYDDTLDFSASIDTLTLTFDGDSVITTFDLLLYRYDSLGSTVTYFNSFNPHPGYVHIGELRYYWGGGRDSIYYRDYSANQGGFFWEDIGISVR